MKEYKLDLHGVRHVNARQLVISLIEKYWNVQAELKIITGNSLKMKGIVIKVIKEYDLPYQVSEMCRGFLITWTG
jgi:DNA-nicking Smr family endonuclease